MIFPSIANPWVLFGAGVLGAGLALGGFMYGGHTATVAGDLKYSKHIEADTAANLVTSELARSQEQKLAQALSAKGEAYEKGKKDAEAAAISDTTALRNGTLELRNRWQGCLSGRAADSAAAIRELDAARRDREESSVRIVRAATECDRQVEGLQGTILTYITLANQRGAPAGGER